MKYNSIEKASAGHRLLFEYYIKLKAALRKSANNAALNYLRNILKEHTQVCISYKKLEIQPYLKSSVLSQYETAILASFRSQCTRGIRSNFGKM